MFGTGAWKAVSDSPELLRNFDRQTLVSSSDECLIPSLEKRPDKCLKSPLERLPVELLRLILCHLSPSSVASLTLCSHHMSYLIGRQSLVAIRKQKSERIKFLNCLEKDLPDHRFCSRCLRLHCKITTEDVLLTQSAIEALGRKREIDVVYSYPPINLNFYHVQSAMNRHRFGPSHGITLDFFRRPLPKGPLGLCLQPSTRARIIADEFILRTKYWIPMWSDGTGTRHKKHKPIELCPHNAINYGDKVVKDLIECQLHHRNGNPCFFWDCTKIRNCPCCSTEFDVELRGVEAGSRVLYITTWRNFGCGRSPKDTKWQHQVWNKANDKEVPFILDSYLFNPQNNRLAYESR